MPGTDQTAGDVLRSVLDEWQAGIASHDPGRVAAVFAEDAIFQGLKPCSVGREAVFAYYDGQPAGMSVDYAILATRRPADTVVLGHLRVDFVFADRTRIPLSLGVTVVETAEGWRIAHYQVSAIPA